VEQNKNSNDRGSAGEKTGFSCFALTSATVEETCRSAMLDGKGVIRKPTVEIN